MKTNEIKISGDTITGEWCRSNTSSRLLVICHGLNDSHKNPTIIAISNGLNKNGHDTFNFNFSKNLGGFDIEHQVEDIVRIVGHFKKYDEIILVGASFAALTTAIATIKINKVSGLVTINGFFGKRALGQKHRKSYRKFRLAAIVTPKYKKIHKYYRSNLRPDKIKVPVAVIHSKVDNYVFIDQSHKFYKAVNSPKQFVELEKSDHGITNPTDREEVVVAIHRWLMENTK